MTRLVLVAAALLTDREGRVLLAARPEGKMMAGWYEFPGGKVEPGEAPEAALVRELQEELGVTVALSALEPFTFASHHYARDVDGGILEPFHLLMLCYRIRTWTGDPHPHESQTLAWTHPRNMLALKLLPADIPVVERLLQSSSSA